MKRHATDLQIPFSRTQYGRKERISCRHTSTYLQAHRVLLYLLGALALVLVGGIDPEAKGELGPCFDRLVVELLDELEEREGAEALAARLWRRPERLPERRRVRRQRHRRVAVQYEAHVGVLDRCSRHPPVRQRRPNHHRRRRVSPNRRRCSRRRRQGGCSHPSALALHRNGNRHFLAGGVRRRVV